MFKNKKLPVLLVSIILVAVMAIGVSAAKFTDVYEYREAIEMLSSIEVIKGYSETSFGPNDDVTRWQMALLMSKLVTGNVATATWESSNGSVKFEDVQSHHYIGSIQYAASKGIIIGTGETTFHPENNIKYQDALTMVVRSLGYPREQLDAGYPDSYIAKAKELGLTKGLENVANEKALSRGQTAQLLFNALTTKNTSGTTYYTTSFNLVEEKLVLTATEKNKLTATSGYPMGGHLNFNVLNNDGTFGSTVSIKASLLNLTNPDDYLGVSFEVKANRTYTSIYSFEANPKATVESMTVNAQNGTINIANINYTLVSSYTYGLDTIRPTNFNEVIVYNGPSAYTVGGAKQYATDLSGNYIDSLGNIVMYRTIQAGGEAYVVIENGVQRAPTVADYAKLAYTTVNSTAVTAYEVLDAKKIDGTQGSFKLIAFDDNNDGYVDRAIYKPYSFGQYIVDSSSKINLAGNNTAISVTHTGITAKTGDYVLYYYDSNSKTLDIAKVFTKLTAAISSINTTADTAVIGTTTYSYTGSKILGANESYDIEKALGVVNNVVSFIAHNNCILGVIEAVQEGEWAVVNSVNGTYYGATYLPMTVYHNGVLTTINVSSINGTGITYVTTNNHPKKGDLVKIAPVASAIGYNAATYNMVTTGINYNYTALATRYFKIENNIAGVYTGNVSGIVANVDPAFNPIYLNANTLVVVNDGTTITAARATNTTVVNLVLNSGAKIFYETDATTGYVKFLYINGASVQSSTSTLTGTAHTVVYINAGTNVEYSGLSIDNPLTPASDPVFYATLNAIDISTGLVARVWIPYNVASASGFANGGYYRVRLVGSGAYSGNYVMDASSLPAGTSITLENGEKFTIGTTAEYKRSVPNMVTTINGTATYTDVKVYYLLNGKMVSVSTENTNANDFSNSVDVKITSKVDVLINELTKTITIIDKMA